MSDRELKGLLDVLAALLSDARIGVLMLLLLAAAICDARSHRIPNRLVLLGSVFGAIYTTLVPPGTPPGVLFPFSGLVVGLLLFLPLHLAGAMGAGDVKLLAMAGTFLGPLETLNAALASMLVGGAMAIVWVLARGRLTEVLQNAASILHLVAVRAVPGRRAAPPVVQVSAGKISYGVAIAAGTIGYLISRQSGLL